jgi:hypothetical protein
LNKKQNSRDAITNYRNKRNEISKLIPEINSITESVVSTNSIDVFIHQLEKHEMLLSTILEKETAKQLYFPDFNGTIKSLGAWGGDFVMAISNDNPTVYFKSKGFDTILPYQEMIL